MKILSSLAIATVLFLASCSSTEYIGKQGDSILKSKRVNTSCINY